MFSLSLLAIFIISGLGLGIVYNKCIIKQYPDYKRKPAYFFTILIFFTFSLLIYVVISVKNYTSLKVNDYLTKMEQYIVNNYPDNELVKNGVDLNGINDVASEINTAVTELKALLPAYKELGVDKLFYDLLVNYAVNELQKRFALINYSTKIINTFADKNDVLTVSSVIYGLKTNMKKIIDIISFIIMAIFAIGLSIYILHSSLIVKRERRFRNL